MYKNNVSKKERKEKIRNTLTTSLKKITTFPLTQWSLKLTLPLRVTTFISKTTSPFCHEWQRVECQVDISSIEVAFPSSFEASLSSPSSSSSSSASELEATGWGGEGVGSGAKLPITACHCAIRSTWTFTWYNSVESVSRRASMRCSWIRDGAKREEGAAESVYHDRN